MTIGGGAPQNDDRGEELRRITRGGGRLRGFLTEAELMGFRTCCPKSSLEEMRLPYTQFINPETMADRVRDWTFPRGCGILKQRLIRSSKAAHEQLEAVLNTAKFQLAGGNT